VPVSKLGADLRVECGMPEMIAGTDGFCSLMFETFGLGLSLHDVYTEVYRRARGSTVDRGPEEATAKGI
jgi:hypothetical protein